MKKWALLLCFTFSGFSVFAQIDYSTSIQPIFTSECNSCHSVGQNGFDSSSYEDVIASMSPPSTYDSKQVIPGDADASPLVDKIEPNPMFGTRMPQGGALTQNEINRIRQWINEGANEQVATSNEDETVLQKEFKLLGNYPNPFNPTTTIQFQLATSTDFQIIIYNANGQLVQSISGRALAGVKEQSIDLTNQSSGVYFYRVRATVNGSTALVGSGRMTLIK